MSKDEGATFDNSKKETRDALDWFNKNTYVIDSVLYWHPINSNGRKRSSVYSNNPSGCVSPRGYIQVRMGKDKFMAHRILWAMYYGTWPKNGIDHINGLKTDNRIDNMRETTQYDNSKNAEKYPRKEPWIATGVFRKGSGFIAHAQVNKEKKYLGSFKCHTSAHIARLIFDIKNGFTIRHGSKGLN
jgi:hypothetical protein